MLCTYILLLLVSSLLDNLYEWLFRYINAWIHTIFHTFLIIIALQHIYPSIFRANTSYSFQITQSQKSRFLHFFENVQFDIFHAYIAFSSLHCIQTCYKWHLNSFISLFLSYLWLFLGLWCLHHVAYFWGVENNQIRNY